MPITATRISWDTNVKHYIRNGLFDNLPDNIKIQIPKTNKHRWKLKKIVNILVVKLPIL
jgi:hypothetical protein